MTLDSGQIFFKENVVGELVISYILSGDLEGGQFGSWAILHRVISPIGQFLLLSDSTCFQK